MKRLLSLTVAVLMGFASAPVHAQNAGVVEGAVVVENSVDQFSDNVDRDLSFDEIVQNACSGGGADCAAIIGTIPPGNTALRQTAVQTAVNNPNISGEELGGVVEAATEGTTPQQAAEIGEAARDAAAGNQARQDEVEQQLAESNVPSSTGTGGGTQQSNDTAQDQSVADASDDDDDDDDDDDAEDEDDASPA